MLKKVLSWPWAQAALWLIGIFALLIGAGGDYGTNWGPIAVGGIFIAAAIALAFLRLQRQRLERTEPRPEVAPQHESQAQSAPVASVEERATPFVTDAADQGERKRRGWWRNALNLVVIVIAIAAGRAAVQYFGSLDDPANMSDAELIRQMESEMSDHVVSPTYQRMKTDFPADYDAFLREMIGVVRSGGDQAEAYTRGQTFMAQFFERHRSFIRRGSSTSLSQALETQTAFLRGLESTRPDVCAEVVESGRLPADDGLAILPDYSTTMNNMNVALFDAILTGRQVATERASVADHEWDAAVNRAAALGADMAVLDALAQGTASTFTDEQKCRTAVALYTALTEGDDLELEARFAAEILAPVQ